MSKNMIFYILLLAAVIILGIVFTLQSKTTIFTEVTDKKATNVEIHGQTYNLEIANTPASQQKGLMNRTELAKNGGMLFIFNGTGIYPFWMKNTLIPLDIIWLNQQKEVVYIKENAQPCKNVMEALCSSIVPLKPALYVIELNAGEVQKLNLKTGDKIEISL